MEIPFWKFVFLQRLWNVEMMEDPDNVDGDLILDRMKEVYNIIYEKIDYQLTFVNKPNDPSVKIDFIPNYKIKTYKNSQRICEFIKFIDYLGYRYLYVDFIYPFIASFGKKYKYIRNLSVSHQQFITEHYCTHCKNWNSSDRDEMQEIEELNRTLNG